MCRDEETLGFKFYTDTHSPQGTFFLAIALVSFGFLCPQCVHIGLMNLLQWWERQAQGKLFIGSGDYSCHYRR